MCLLRTKFQQTCRLSACFAKYPRHPWARIGCIRLHFANPLGMSHTKAQRLNLWALNSFSRMGGAGRYMFPCPLRLSQDTHPFFPELGCECCRVQGACCYSILCCGCRPSALPLESSAQN